MTELIIAAVQPRLVPGDVEGNLRRVEELVRGAHGRHRPDLIVLPDSMTSPQGGTVDVDRVPRHIDGAPLNLLRQLAADLGCAITGGALSVRGGHTFQTYMLVEPDGVIYLHNRSVLASSEYAWCRAGTAPGVLISDLLGAQQPLGLVSGPEWASSAVARALHEHRVGLVVGGLDLPMRRGRRKGGRRAAREAAIQFSRCLGVSTVMTGHAAAGLGSRICSPDGTVLAELGHEEGVISAAVPIGRHRVASIPGAMWQPGPIGSRDLGTGTRIAAGAATYWTRWARNDFPWQDSAHSDLPDVIRPDLPAAAGSPQQKGETDDYLTLTVAKRRFPAEGVVHLTLRGPDGAPLPAWRPGAHIDLLLDDEMVRQYSLCGNPGDPHYEIAVLLERQGRGGSVRVHDRLDVGEKVRARGPRNHFELEDAEHYVFIAGGIGITPIKAMVGVAHDRGRSFRLFYGGRSEASMAFADELAERYQESVLLQPEDRDGLLDIRAILTDCPKGTLVYCCGPEALLRAVEAEIRRHPSLGLRLERFSSLPADGGSDAPIELTLEASGLSLTVPAGTSVLTALHEAGVDVDYSCQAGVCGSCEVSVLAGTPEHRDAILTSSQPNDRMLPCVSWARTSHLTLDL
ncbi:ferredoxin-NADP reductase [Actinocorallia herbida]|uniref:Ferredoxin-NADP reductase n=1 Tax=Actinocorallia herbida TaxID=58109 RepID=A0A3N1D2T8_9ACTN|nr:2Fe-2S iron-sulfur cluster-binding protein [Actinocorallia herbida]ROO87843.1 ferredoxin-NADP reductase [Actinocorallia herbida]